MKAATYFTVYFWIGWAITTGALACLWWLTGLLALSTFERLRRMYHLTVLGYWLHRLEKGGMRVFRKAEREDAEKRRSRVCAALDSDIE